MVTGRERERGEGKEGESEDEERGGREKGKVKKMYTAEGRRTGHT